MSMNARSTNPDGGLAYFVDSANWTLCSTSASCGIQSSLRWRFCQQHDIHRLNHTHSNPTAHTIDVSMSGKNARWGNRCVCTTVLYSSSSAIRPRPMQSAFVSSTTFVSASPIACVESPACSCAPLHASRFERNSPFCQPSESLLVKPVPSRRQLASKNIENINICNDNDVLRSPMHARCPLVQLQGHLAVVEWMTHKVC